MSYETREQRRAALSARTGQLLQAMAEESAAGRLRWYRDNRGRFFFEPGEREERIRLLGRRRDIVAAAERLLRHEFDILGSGLVPLGDRIDWQRDFKSGTRWRNDVIYPAWNWRKVDDLAGAEIFRGHFYSIDDASDLKMPWDLSSFFHLPVLGEAFLETGDRRYAAEVIDELRDWHAENPYPRGVNWTCAMVAGIRLANLAFTLRQLEPEEFIGEYGVLSILRHLKFILDFLEVDQDGRRNNHYLNNLVGLGFGGVEIARSRLGRELLDFVFEELKTELATQFSADATNYEGSLPYHRFAAESSILTAILLEHNGRATPPEIRTQLERILRFIDAYTKPNGLAPQFGDNDNGRILVLHDYAAQEYRDHRHILAVGAEWLGIGDLSADLAGQAADAIWILGRPPQTTAVARTISGIYNSNGYALAKTAESFFLVRCGRINPMSGGGHNHCDQLSFEFHDRRQDVVIDPGAMIYSADAALRNYARSTAAHNVLQLDDREQQEFDPRDLFSMQDRAEATIDAWQFEDGIAVFRGHHSAWRAAGWNVSRECRCNLREGTLRLADRVEPAAASTQGREFCGRLHLAAEIVVEQVAASAFRLRIGGAEWTVRFDEQLRVGCTEGRVSPSYGVTMPAAVLEYRFAAAGARTASWSIQRS